jgi:uncharacterized protein (TIGR02117 family)
LSYFLKYILKPIGGAIEFFLAFAMLYFIFSVLGGVIAVNGIEVEDAQLIYVRTNGVHTDLCLPVVTEDYDWKTFIPAEDFPNNEHFEFIAIGWGDKGFFLDTPEWSDLTFSTAFHAAFTSSPTAMHVQYFDYEPAVSENCLAIEMEKSLYPDLIEYIRNSFELKSEKVELIPNRGYWKNDNFYEAKGSYHLFKTCNRWTNKGLKVAGVKTGAFALWSDGIMRHLR